MTKIVKVLKETTINGIAYVVGDTIDLEATGQVDDYYSEYSFIIPRANKEISLQVADTDPVLSEYISPHMNMLEFDFTLLDAVRSESPHYVRGRKTRAEYYVGDLLAATKDFLDVLDENNMLKELWVDFSWYDHVGNIVFSKKQMVKKYNKFESETAMRKRRERQLDFLIGAAKGTPQEQYLTMLLTHYREYKNNYVSENSLEWSQKIDEDLNRDLTSLPVEQQQYFGAIQQILNGDTARVDDPTTSMKIWQALKYQIGTFDLSEIGL